jgi:acetyl-CoA acetyltransferase
VSNDFRGRTAFIGTAETGVTRHSTGTMGGLAVQACRDAIADAGLEPPDIDCIVSYTRPVEWYPDSLDGLNRASVPYVQEGLGIPYLRSYADIWGPGADAFSPAIHAAHTVAVGRARFALVYAVVGRPLDRKYGEVSGRYWRGPSQFTMPYGFGTSPQIIGLYTQRYLYESGLTREDLWTVIANDRKWSSQNPGAMLRETLALNDYLDAEIMSEPISLFDCDLPVFGAWAYVIASSDDARDMPVTPAYIAALQLGQGPRPANFELWHDFSKMAPSYAFQDLWDNAGVDPLDIDVAQIYDGFSPLAFYNLDGLGYTKIGEGGTFMHQVLDADKPFPVNTFGGSLGHGRGHGASHLHEAILQVTGKAGARQVPNCETSLATIGGFMVGAAAVLTKDDPRE